VSETSSDAIKPAPPTARATIYDLGYKRYAGGRRPQSTRWRVISRNQLAQSWKTWWRFKAWIALTVLITVVLGAVMVLIQKEEFTPLRRNGAFIKMIDGMVFGSGSFYARVCFLLSLTAGAGVVATDMRSGAFTFYFARPVRALDYIAGKLVGLFVLQACVILVPMIVLTLVRLGLSHDTDELLRNLSYLPKAMLIGTMGALAFAGLSLGFSSLLPSPRQSVALWAGYYILISTMFVGVGMALKIPELGVIDIAFAIETLAYRLFDVAPSTDVPMASLPAAVAALLGNVALGVGIAYLRIRATAHAGIGGGS
jgi:ABC-type transport system involved in multi-copper enzyme maturation permease subunit